jgi:hypothetical protein
MSCPKCKNPNPTKRTAVGARLAFGPALSAGLLAVLAGCSGSSGPAASSPKLAGGSSPGGCEASPLSIQDVTGILVAPITGSKPVSGDAQSCEFSTGGFPAIVISVRPGLGKSSVDAWIEGRMPLKAEPLPGVGDAAAWQASLREVIAEKRNVLCDIQVHGGATDLAVSVSALPGALGALCNRIFAGG